MCCVLVSCADFEAILTAFNLVKLFQIVVCPSKADHSTDYWPEVTPQIALSSKEKFPNHNKTNSSIKPTTNFTPNTCASAGILAPTAIGQGQAIWLHLQL